MCLVCWSQCPLVLSVHSFFFGPRADETWRLLSIVPSVKAVFPAPSCSRATTMMCPEQTPPTARRRTSATAPSSVLTWRFTTSSVTRSAVQPGSPSTTVAGPAGVKPSMVVLGTPAALDVSWLPVCLHCGLRCVVSALSLVLDGSLDADRRAAQMLKWDVLNGVRASAFHAALCLVCLVLCK